MNPWFRMYSEIADDPKVQMMPEAMQRRLVMLMCLKCKERLGKLSDMEVAFELRIPFPEASETKALFLAQGFIDEKWDLVNWNKRQFVSDSSKGRTQRYRDKREASGLTRGSGPLSNRELYERDEWQCIYCGSGKKLCIDHIYPIIMGGTDDWDNLGVACKQCNSGKAGRTPEMARYQINNSNALDRYRRYCDGHSLDVTVTVTAQNRTEQNRNIKRPTPKAALSAFAIPPSIEAKTWADFEEHRKKLRKPMTDRARNGIVSDLGKLGGDPNALLVQSITRGWAGVFELKTAPAALFPVAPKPKTQYEIDRDEQQAERREALRLAGAQ